MASAPTSLPTYTEEEPNKMNHWNRIFATLTLAGVLAVGAFAQSAGTTGGAVTSAPAAGAKGKHAGGWKNLMETNKQILAQLDLSADQKTKIAGLDKDLRAKIKEIAEDAKKSSTPEDKKEARKKIQEAFKDYTQNLKGLLTPDQRTKYDQLWKEAREKAKEQKAGGAAKPAGL